MMAQAEQMANQLLNMPYEQRTSEMRKIKHSNETLHALVKAKIESIKSQAQSKGGYQALQQMTQPQQGQGPATIVTTPEDMVRVAGEMALQLLGLPLNTRLIELRLIKNENEVMHALVVAHLKKFRNF
jgi:hypothetical protein